MSIVVYCKISRQDYDALAIKDEDTLYAVNDNGDFSDANLNNEAELYLGNKRLTPEIVGTTGQSTTAVMSQKATTDAINNFVLPYGECSTAGDTAAKVVTTSDGSFTLKRGARVMVKFINTHTASSMTLNVNGTGAKGVYWNGVAVDANKVFGYTAYEFVYDGTYYRITGIATYNNATTSTSGLMSSADKTKLDGMDLSKYLPLTGGTLTGSLTTKGLIVNGGDVKLANYSNGKIHGHQSSQAIGNYSTALGYNSRTQVPTGDSSLPYGYITSVSPLSFTIVDDTLYGVSLAKNDRTTYTYNGVNYTVTNPNATYHASVFLVKDTDNTLLKGTSYPNNVCIIAKSSVTLGAGRILAVKNIVDDVYEIIVNQQNTTLQSYTSALTMYVFKKNNSSNYDGTSSVASGYYSVASGTSSVASGAYSVASGAYSVASGAYSVASGYYSVASGYYSVASGISSVASGRNSKASYQDSAVLAPYGISGRNQQCVVGFCNKQDSNSYFIVGNGSSDTARSNAMTVNTDGTTNIAGDLLPMATNTKSLGSTSLKWANVYATTFNGNATSADKVNKALTIKQGSTTDTYDGSAAKTIDITKLNDIGTLSDLQTSNKTTIVDAINEVNAKANNSTGGGTVNDSTISPFAGFVNIADIIIEETTFVGTGGSVLYYARQNMFLLTDGQKYYKDWANYSLYNTSNSTNVSARADKFFSYNGSHYMIINGSLQDISNIEKVLKSYSDANKEVTINAANIIAANQANNALTQAKNYADNVGSTTLANAQRLANTAESNANTYTDTTIAAKIQLVSALPSNPTAGVLYLIPDEE